MAPKMCISCLWSATQKMCSCPSPGTCESGFIGNRAIACVIKGLRMRLSWYTSSLMVGGAIRDGRGEDTVREEEETV